MIKKENFNLLGTEKRGVEYIDINKHKKGILTDFIDNNFLKYNKNQLLLLRLIYEKINKKLEKYNLFLVYKGGNVMRLINNNIKKYFPLGTDEIIMDVFEPFLKQSDNDFTVFIDPNTKNYDKFLTKITNLIFYELEQIKVILSLNLSYYFDIFNLKGNKINNLFKNLTKELNVDSVKLVNKGDNLIEFGKKNDILIYEKNNSSISFIYNIINFALEFYDISGNIINFNLLRTKINFLLNNKENVSGELIDISLPTKKDIHMKYFKTSEKFNKFIDENIIKVKNKEFNFNYYIININYIIEDLYGILFIKYIFPWEDEKYEKRLARMLYFIFLNMIDKYGISNNNLHSIIFMFDLFKKLIIIKKNIELEKFKKILDNDYIYSLIIENKRIIYNIKTLKDTFNYKKFIENIDHYSDAIIRICNNLLNYLEGKEKVDENELYKLNIN